MASIKVEQLTKAMTLFDEFIDEAEDLLVNKKKATSERDTDCLKLEKEIESCKRHKTKFTTRLLSLLVKLENEKTYNLLKQRSTQLGGHQQQQSPVLRDESEGCNSAPSSTCLSAKSRNRMEMEVVPDKILNATRRGCKRKLVTEADPRNGSDRQFATLRNDPVSGAGKEFCKTYLQTSPLLRNHFNEVHGGRSYHSCQTCGNGFRKTIHRRIHGGKTFSCVFCNSRFHKNKASLESHIRRHTLEKPYWCNICDHECSSQSHLCLHMRVHTGEKPFQCEICHKSFQQQYHLNRHLRSHTGEKPYVCNVCDRGFTRSENLKLHMRTHTGEKPYKCEICNHGFAYQNALVGHMRTHTGEKPYKCEICNHGFAYQNALVVLMRTHTGEKPYKCEICNHGFAYQNALVGHMRTHTGEKPYKCEICNHGFAYQNALVVHMRTHTGEKPHKCEICNHGFAQQNGLMCHMRIHSGKKPYSCKVCGKTFASSDQCKGHLKTHEKKYFI